MYKCDYVYEIKWSDEGHFECPVKAWLDVPIHACFLSKYTKFPQDGSLSLQFNKTSAGLYITYH